MKPARTVTWALAACCGWLGACERPDEPPRDAPATSLPAVVSLAGNAPERIPAAAWTDTATRFAETIKGARLHRTAGALVLALDHRRFEPVVLARADAPNLSGANALDGGATVVVGSGFVSEFQSLEPLGLLQINGKIVSPVSPHGYTRILGVREGRLGVLARREYHRGLLESALQVGPGIVEGGALDISPRERNLPAYFRAFAATCAERDLVGVTTRPMHLFDLGNELLGLFEATALDCAEVANLGGDREALLGLRAEGRTFFVGNPNAARAALVAFRHATTGAR